MLSDTYLQRLNDRLSRVVARLPEATRRRHAAFLRERQRSDGSFCDREGGSDLYYTAFGLRGLSILGELDNDTCNLAAGYLKQSLMQQASVVDFYSLLYACLLIQITIGMDVLADSPSDWPDRVAAVLESVRADDGGYGKKVGDKSGSTYHTFLVGLSYQLLNRPYPRADAVAEFVLSRQRDDGGFVEMRPMKRSGTNPTAAAIGTLQMLEERTERKLITPEMRERVLDHLCEMMDDDGGLRANGRIPVADVLSTFTGTWTIDQLGALNEFETEASLEFVRSLENDAGGFHGGIWDDATDVEYTFYGLGALALLAMQLRG